MSIEILYLLRHDAIPPSTYNGLDKYKIISWHREGCHLPMTHLLLLQLETVIKDNTHQLIVNKHTTKRGTITFDILVTWKITIGDMGMKEVIIVVYCTMCTGQCIGKDATANDPSMQV